MVIVGVVRLIEKFGIEELRDSKLRQASDSRRLSCCKL